MVDCLLCLFSTQDVKNCIQVDSLEWQELQINNIIHKHLWPLDPANDNSWLCSICWEELHNFHKFYTRIEQAQKSFKSLSTPEAYPLVEDIKPNVVELQKNLLEPEITFEETLETDTIVKQEYEETRVLPPIDYEMAEMQANDLQHIGELTGHPVFGKDTDDDGISDDDGDDDSDNDIDKSNDFISSEELKSNSETDKKKKIVKSKSSGANASRKAGNQPKIDRDKFLQEHYKMTCTICSLPFDTFILLCQHFKDVHNERGYATCCEQKFFDRSLLVDHINCHLNPEYFKCKHCGKVVTQRRYLRTHMLLHAEKKYQCDVCNKKFVNTFKLERHKMAHLSQEEKKFPCTDCDKSFANEYVLNQHHRIVHLQIKSKICEICGHSTADSNSFQRHMEKHASESTKVACEDCGLVVAGRHRLKRHRETQHPVGGKRDHICHICQRVSPTKKALKKHIQTVHEMGYNYKCTMCEKQFKRPDNFKAHMSIHTGQPTYSCTWCDKKFFSSATMHSHRKKVHPVEWEESVRKKYSGNLPPNYKRSATSKKSK